ncbi:MAG TPA: type II toxin-antitoxin system VapC family toxin [Gemmatimonadales bacterium]
MTLVADASVVVAALVDSGPDGAWAERVLTRDHLVAPQLMPAEVANMLRRAVLAKELSDYAASLAHADLSALHVGLFPYAPFAERVWDLRANLTAHDAWYVALAEALNAKLVTLDTRLSRAAGPRCGFVIPPR